MKKIIAFYGFIITLLGNTPAFANSAVEATIQFKNEDSKNSVPLVSTVQPYLDNFTWVDVRPEYKAVWDFSTRTQTFKDVDKITLIPGDSVAAQLSYDWNENSYGMSQYAFNYENRSPAYGCFVTELRVSSAWWYSHNLAFASYRKDPEHADDYLTCRIESKAATSFTVHMTSSKNKKEENLLADDSKRYSVAGDAGILGSLDYYGIDLPIVLWKNQEKNNPSLVLLKNKTFPELLPIPINKASPRAKNITIIRFVNNTTHALVAGQLWLDKFSDLSSKYYLQQPPVLQPASLSQKKNTAKLAVPSENSFAFARLNYHISGYAEDSGCYITASLKSVPAGSTFWTTYRFDLKHPAPEKNLYCFISPDIEDMDNKAITVTFYEDPSAMKGEIENPSFEEPYVSYSMVHHQDRALDPLYRRYPTYDHGEKFQQDKAITFNYELMPSRE